MARNWRPGAGRGGGGEGGAGEVAEASGATEWILAMMKVFCMPTVVVDT